MKENDNFIRYFHTFFNLFSNVKSIFTYILESVCETHGLPSPCIDIKLKLYFDYPYPHSKRYVKNVKEYEILFLKNDLSPKKVILMLEVV